MKDILDIFNNRELSIIIWSIIVAISIVFLKKMRKPTRDVIVAFFAKHFVKIYLIMLFYLTPIVLVLSKFSFWNSKNFVFWLLGVGFVLLFKTNQATNTNYFKKLLFSALKITAIFQFVMQSYTFSFWTEFIALPCVTFILLLQIVAEREVKHKPANNILKVLIAILSVSVLTYSIYKSINDFGNFYSLNNALTFLFPILLTALFLPFIYLVSIYSIYESFFVSLEVMTVKKKEVKILKRAIFKTAGLNLNKLTQIKTNFNRRIIHEDVNLKEYIKSISKNAPNK